VLDDPTAPEDQVERETMMIANVGKLDRAFRLVLGVVLLGLGLGFFKSASLEPNFAIGVDIVGVVLIATAVLSFCPAYRLFGITTCSK
jgi:hypothetical protein